MPATIIDSNIFGNIFSTDDMRGVWSDENRTRHYLAIEKGLAKLIRLTPPWSGRTLPAPCRMPPATKARDSGR